jgi:hypothetical protein
VVVYWQKSTFVPNLVWSFDAPTTAKLGEDKKFFLMCSGLAISGLLEVVREKEAMANDGLYISPCAIFPTSRAIGQMNGWMNKME